MADTSTQPMQTATTPAAADPKRRGLSFLVVVMATICLSASAMADVPTDRLSGRWRAVNRNLVLDISRCDTGWCGVERTDERHCSATILRVDAGRPDGAAAVFLGTLRFEEMSQNYDVRAALWLRNESLALNIRGNTAGPLALMRRTFAFSSDFERIGDATCKPTDKVS